MLLHQVIIKLLICFLVHYLLKLLTIVDERIVFSFLRWLLQKIFDLYVLHHWGVIVVIDRNSNAGWRWLDTPVEVVLEEIPDAAVVAVLFVFFLEFSDPSRGRSYFLIDSV